MEAGPPGLTLGLVPRFALLALTTLTGQEPAQTQPRHSEGQIAREATQKRWPVNLFHVRV